MQRPDARALALLLALVGASPVRAEAPSGSAGEVQGPPMAMEVLGVQVQPGERRLLRLSVSESFAGSPVESPVTVIAGTLPGPRLCLTGGVHGDELIGVEIVRRTLEALQPVGLRGSVVGLPIANLSAFRRSSRYLPDRRDLNRYFPGRPFGSSASRVAHAIFDGVIRHCSALIDFHTGSFHRINLPQVRGNLRDPDILAMAEAFGRVIAIHHPGSPGTLRRAATDAGIPAITYEAGGPMRLEAAEVERGFAGVIGLLAALEMIPSGPIEVAKPDFYWSSHWVRVDEGGILDASVRLGDAVERDQILGTVFDPVSNERGEIRAAAAGRVIGMAVDQVVMPGFAAFHVAVSGDPNAAVVDVAEVAEEEERGREPEVEERPE